MSTISWPASGALTLQALRARATINRAAFCTGSPSAVAGCHAVCRGRRFEHSLAPDCREQPREIGTQNLVDQLRRPAAPCQIIGQGEKSPWSVVFRDQVEYVR